MQPRVRRRSRAASLPCIVFADADLDAPMAAGALCYPAGTDFRFIEISGTG
jgi:hypothetical protein